MFLTIYKHQFGWLSEGGDNFLNLLQKEGGGGYPEKVGGGLTLEETVVDDTFLVSNESNDNRWRDSEK